jgi:hypothetical protein
VVNAVPPRASVIVVVVVVALLSAVRVHSAILLGPRVVRRGVLVAAATVSVSMTVAVAVARWIIVAIDLPVAVCRHLAAMSPAVMVMGFWPWWWISRRDGVAGQRVSRGRWSEAAEREEDHLVGGGSASDQRLGAIGAGGARDVATGGGGCCGCRHGG